MDERQIEQGYANFHRRLNRVLRHKDVKAFKAHVASHPHQAGRLTHCLMLNDELAEIEMYRAIVVRSALKDIHQEATEWLKARGIDPPTVKAQRGRRGGKKPFRTGRKF
jgi:hypothetical protein